jgi:hypothetical protein
MTDLETLIAAKNRLTELRDAATSGPWALSSYDPGEGWFVVVRGDRYVLDTGTRGDADLVVNTIGNPALLDAIDAELTAAIAFPDAHNTTAKRIAAALLTPNEGTNDEQ